jgi:chloride channel 3/4/5
VLCYPNMFLKINMTEMMEILFRECEGGHDYDGLCEYEMLPIYRGNYTDF